MIKTPLLKDKLHILYRCTGEGVKDGIGYVVDTVFPDGEIITHSRPLGKKYGLDCCLSRFIR